MRNFTEIIQSDTYHGEFASYKGKIGQIQLWAWKKCYLFLNFETNKVNKISIAKIHTLNLLDRETFQAKFEKVNYPETLFVKKEGYRPVFIGDKTLYTERQQEFGLVHENVVNLQSVYHTNKIWSGDFVRQISRIIAEYHFYLEIIEKHGTLEKARKDKDIFEGIFKKYLWGPECLSNKVFSQIKDRSITEEKIVDYLRKVKELPIQYSREIMKDKNSSEIKYYQK